MRRSRGRNQFTIAALRRAVNVARQAGVDRVEIEIPGESRIILTGITSEASRTSGPAEVNEWDEELYGKNPPPVR
jgi:hypothetical protein